MDKRYEEGRFEISHAEGCEEVRCACGRLVARLVPGGVELKCGRCRRVVVLPLAPENVDGGHDGGAEG